MATFKPKAAGSQIETLWDDNQTTLWNGRDKSRPYNLKPKGGFFGEASE
jgi:hypothetical protein